MIFDSILLALENLNFKWQARIVDLHANAAIRKQLLLWRLALRLALPLHVTMGLNHLSGRSGGFIQSNLTDWISTFCRRPEVGVKFIKQPKKMILEQLKHHLILMPLDLGTLNI